ncbi:MAG: hypothetical protein ABSF43_06490 [Rectinemataceae bacterium]|jgi:hypothetical protein
MSELAIGLVAEGITDFVIIEAALKACLKNPFVLTLLQPEETRPEMQGGWGGVYKWCRAEATMGFGSLEFDPTLSRFDLLIIHIDADVAEDNYSDIGESPTDVLTLPCSKDCPPPEATVKVLRSVVLSWLGMAALGSKAIFCIPSKATEAWLAVAAASDRPIVMIKLECSLNMEARLASLPKGRKIKKTKRQYQGYATIFKNQWGRVVAMCTQAKCFQDDLATHVPNSELNV